MEVLRRNGVDTETLVALQTDVTLVKTDPKEKALFTLAAVVTKDPGRAAGAVLETVKAGWSEEEVSEAVFLVSMYNMANRVADAYAFPPDQAHPYDPKSRLPLLSCP